VSTWQQVFSHGHIVTFRFPVRDSDDKPKIRPCLVLDTYIRDGQEFAVLAYGTTADTNANRALAHLRGERVRRLSHDAPSLSVQGRAYWG